MLIVLIVLQVLMLAALLMLLLRSRRVSEGPSTDTRLEATLEQMLAPLLNADLATQFTRLEARSEARSDALDRQLRAELGQIRQESANTGAALRHEVLNGISTLGEALSANLNVFRGDSATQATAGRETLHQRLAELHHAQADHMDRLRGAQTEHMDKLRGTQSEQMEKLRSTVEARLDALNHANEAKLEQMRLTVDEKLQRTLHSRLTESFGAVTDQLTKVHAGLGEMNALTTGVNDLNRLFSNVKSRGGFAEVQLGKLLDQVLAPGQFVQNANVRPNTQEVVEYAVRFPGASGDVLLPIDAKFPREDWERLESAYESTDGAAIEIARRAFDAAIRTEGKRICSKYINEPVTTPYAIMFLPTEGLYAEVLRRDGLQSELHQNCRVMVAGPTNLYALLTSFQLGFRILNLQKKGDEVWKTLASTQSEFRKFESLMDRVEKNVTTVQNTLHDLGVRTRAINKTLHHVGEVTPGEAKVLSMDGLLPLLTGQQENAGD